MALRLPSVEEVLDRAGPSDSVSRASSLPDPAEVLRDFEAPTPTEPESFGRTLLEGAAETGRQIVRGSGNVVGAVGDLATKAFSTGGAEQDLAARAPKSPTPTAQPAEVQPELRVAPEPGVFSRLLSGLGLFDLGKQDAKAVGQIVNREADAKAGPRESTKTEQLAGYAEQAVHGVNQALSLGLSDPLLRAVGAPVTAKPETTAEGIAYGVGHLAGFMGTPLAAGRALAEATVGRYVIPLMTDTIRTIVGKAVMKEATTLMGASMAAETGHAFEQQSILDGFAVELKAAKKGLLTGAIFGAVPGTFTGTDLPGLAARWGVGMALHDVSESLDNGKLQHPFDERPIAEKMFGYGLDLLYLFHARDPRVVLSGLRGEAKARGVSLDDHVKLAIAEARTKVEAAEFGRLVSVFRRRGQGQGEAEMSAAQAILQREAGRVAYADAAKRADEQAAAEPQRAPAPPQQAPPEAATRPPEAPAAPAEVARRSEAEVAPSAAGGPAGVPRQGLPSVEEVFATTPSLSMPAEPGDAVRQAEANLGPGATPEQIEAEINRIAGVPATEPVLAEVPGATAAVGETVPETPAPPAPLKGEETVPQAMTFEKTAVGPQALIPGAPSRTVPTTAIRRGDRGVSDLPLVAASQETGRQADLPAGEALDPQRAAVQEWLADQLGSGPQMSLATAKSAQLMPKALRAKLQSLGIDPKDAWDVTHAAVPRVDAMERLVGLSTGVTPKSITAEVPAEGRPVAAISGRAPTQPKMFPGGVAQDYASVNTRDPLEVDQFIRGVGGLNPKTHSAELEDAPLYLKNTQAEQTIDTLARDIAEAQGRDQYEVANELLDSVRALAGKKAEAATKPWNQPDPPTGMGVSAAEWQAMGASERQGLWEFSDAMDRQAIPEMEAAFADTAPELAISEAVVEARAAMETDAAQSGLRILQTPEGEPIARLRNVDSPGRGMGTWEVEEWIDGPGAKRALPFGQVGTYGEYFRGRVAKKLLFSKTGAVSRSGATLGYLQTASADAKYLAVSAGGRPSDPMAGRIHDTLRDFADTPDRGEQVIDTYLKMADLVTNDPTVRAMTKPEDRTPAALWEWARKKVSDEITRGTDSRREPSVAGQVDRGGRSEDRRVAEAAGADLAIPATAGARQPAAAPAPPAAAGRGERGAGGRVAEGPGDRIVRTGAVGASGVDPALLADAKTALAQLGIKGNEAKRRIAEALGRGTPESAAALVKDIVSHPDEPVVQRMATGGPATAPPPAAPTPSAGPAPAGQVRRMFGKQAAEAPRKDQMIQALAEAFRMAKAGALAMQGGIVGRKTVRGWRHAVSGNIRARKGTDVDTFAHEFGHALQGKTGVAGRMTGLAISDRELQPFAAEMLALTQVQPVKGKVLEEGFSEFARLYATDPTLARQVAPTFYPWFEARLATVPPLATAFQAFRDQIRTLRALSPEERISRMLANMEQRPLGERAKQATSVAELQRQGTEHVFKYLNRWLPFQQMVALVDPDGTKLPAAMDPNKLGRTMGAAVAEAHAALIGDAHHPEKPQGQLDPTTWRVLPGTKSWMQILKPVGNRMDDFRVYMMARVMAERAVSENPRHQTQAAHLRTLGDLTASDVMDVIARTEAAHPDFRGILDEHQAFDDAFMAVVGASDLKGPAEMAAMKDLGLYIPLARVMDNAGDPQAVGAIGTKAGLGTGFHRTRGTSQRIVVDPLVQYQRNLFAIISAVKRNEIMARALDLTENKDLAAGKFLGLQLEKVATPMKATTVQLSSFRKELEQAFTDAGVPVAILNTLDLDRLATIFRPNRDDLAGNMQVVYRRGEPDVAQVTNPMLMRSVAALTGADMPVVAESADWAAMVFNTLFRAPARLLRRGVVLSPSFLPAHWFREQTEIMASGGSRLMPPFFRGLLASNDTYRRFLSGGGRIFAYRDMAPAALAQNIKDLKDGAWYQGSARREATHWVEKILRVFDETSRIGVMDVALTQSRPVDVLHGERSVDIEAGMRAREAGSDLDLHGASRAFRRYMQFVVFLNASLQGLYRHARVLKEAKANPTGRTAQSIYYAGGLMMLAEIMGYLLNKDDPRYQALTDDQRNLNFYLIPPGLRISQEAWAQMSNAERGQRSNEMFSAPKAFNIVWLFATAPRQVLEWANGREPALFQRLAKSFWQANGFDVLPTTARVGLELVTNKNLYFMRDINRATEKDLPPPMQGRMGGPASTVALSKAFASVPGLNVLTPNDIEHIARGIGGYHGQYAVSIADRILALSRGGPEMPTTRLADYPGVNRYLSRFPPSFSKPQEAFYDAYADVRGAVRGLRKLGAERAPTATQERFRADHEFEIQQAGLILGHAAFLRQQRQTLEAIRTEPTMKGDAKANARDRVLLESFTESRRVMAEFDQAKATYQKPTQAAGAR